MANNVTKEQKKKWWVLSRQLGHNRARRLTLKVTKGISSLTHQKMTRWKMSMVLEAMVQEIAGKGIDINVPVPSVSSNDTQEKIIHLVTRDQRAAIERLKKILKFSAVDFEIMCNRVIKKDLPETYQEAELLMSRMNKAISEIRK